MVVTGLAMAALLSGHYEEAVDRASEATTLYPSWDASFLVLGLALAHAGRGDEARLALGRARHLLEAPSLDQLVASLPIRDDDRRAVIDEGLRLARIADE
jgi:Flp pilus assembly protein TadD